MYSIAARSVARRAVVAPVTRSTVLVNHYSSSVHGNDPEVIETEKQRNLRGEQHKTSTPIKNAPGWNQYLASQSEAAVKADRSDHSPEELATQTVQHIKDRHHTEHSAGKLEGEERVDAYEASYERDDLTGPLKNSAQKEVVEKSEYKERVVRE
ncbi:hypothetical protein BDW22DRAFT_149138 [Trametopsis cervina]|nr:hypothetical protein BDW22DRAFT_149138 [Trametopsis cervina]